MMGDKMMMTINSKLGHMEHSIRVLQVKPVGMQFNSRFGVLRKTYRYRLLIGTPLVRWL